MKAMSEVCAVLRSMKVMNEVCEVRERERERESVLESLSL